MAALLHERCLFRWRQRFRQVILILTSCLWSWVSGRTCLWLQTWLPWGLGLSAAGRMTAWVRLPGRQTSSQARRATVLHSLAVPHTRVPYRRRREGCRMVMSAVGFLRQVLVRLHEQEREDLDVHFLLKLIWSHRWPPSGMPWAAMRATVRMKGMQSSLAKLSSCVDEFPCRAGAG